MDDHWPPLRQVSLEGIQGRLHKIVDVRGGRSVDAAWSVPPPRRGPPESLEGRGETLRSLGDHIDGDPQGTIQGR